MADIKVLMDADVLTGTSIRVAEPSDVAQTLLMTQGTNIILPFPTNVVSTAAPQWEGNDRSKLSVFGETIQQGSGTETLKSWGKGIAGVVTESMKKNTATFGMVGNAFLGKEQMLHNAGKALNPFKQMMFSGMDFRTFDLEFEIVPKTRGEHNSLTQAIREIQVHSVPEILGGMSGLFMEYPDTWRVIFQPNNEHLPAFMPAVVTNVSIDYSGVAGKVVFKDNDAPVSVNLSLSFAETEIFTKQRAKVFYG